MKRLRLGAVRNLPTGMRGEGRSFALDVAGPGFVAGLVGGAVMALTYMSLGAWTGGKFWALPKMIAGMFWRDSHVDEMGVGAILVGLAIHFAVAIGVATTFALILPRTISPFTTMPLAIFFSLMVYVVMMFFVVDYVSPPMRRELNHALWLVAHVPFGMALPLIPPLRRMHWTKLGGVPHRAAYSGFHA